MNIFSIRNTQKPEYIFRPSQIFRRLAYERATDPNEFREILLPWGLLIRVRPYDIIGSNICRLGLYDLCVSEVIWRLLDPGELALDVGANIGHMTSVMASRVGGNGRVVAFEPHPQLFEELMVNASRWITVYGVGGIDIKNIALSDYDGDGMLNFSDDFEVNRGTATLSVNLLGSIQNRRGCKVSLARLDKIFDSASKIGVMKIDVEGHEINVLKGAAALLANHSIRDIIFEEHIRPPSEVTTFLSERGFTIFYLTQTLFGLKVTNINQPVAVNMGEAPNYLATIDPDRALGKLRNKGWQVLRQ